MNKIYTLESRRNSSEKFQSPWMDGETCAVCTSKNNIVGVLTLFGLPYRQSKQSKNSKKAFYLENSKLILKFRWKYEQSKKSNNL